MSIRLCEGKLFNLDDGRKVFVGVSFPDYSLALPA